MYFLVAGLTETGLRASYDKLLAIENQWNVSHAFAASDVRRRRTD